MLVRCLFMLVVMERNPNFSDKSLNEPISREEVREAIHKIKNGKAGGDDTIVNEYIKASANVLIHVPQCVKLLYHLNM